MSEKMTAQSAETKQEPKKLTTEWLQTRSTLEVEAHLNAEPILKALNEKLGTSLQQRPEGFHITIIGPTEKDQIKEMTESDLAELQQISESLQKGEGIIPMGIGYLDGASLPGMREVDKTKKSAFIALDIPALAAFREKKGLSKKDFHVTLGFQGGDIHFAITGTEPGPKGKMKDVLSPIPKKADPAFDEYMKDVEITFGGIEGKAKEEKKEKEAVKPAEKPVEAPKVYSAELLRENLKTYAAEGKIPADSVEEIVAMIVSGGEKDLGRKFGKQMKDIRVAMKASEKAS
jgi:phage FluMu protein gp41